MEQRSLAPIGILAVVAVIGGSLAKNHGSLSQAGNYIAAFFAMLFETILYLGLTALGIYLLILAGRYLFKFYQHVSALEHAQQRQIDALATKVANYIDHISSFDRKVGNLDRKFTATTQEFENFKKTFHAEWRKAAHEVLLKASKDPELISALKLSLFPKMKATDPNSKMEVSDAYAKRYASDQHL